MAAALVAISLVILIFVSRWVTGEDSSTVNDKKSEPTLLAAPETSWRETGVKTTRKIVEGFAGAPLSADQSSIESDLVPEQWEKPLFDILLNEEQTMDERNARLLELATGPAKGVPAVQEECLMHLMYGIPDNNGAQFVEVATNSAIPVEMRAEFLKEALAIRPAELGEWISQQVTNHYEPAISSIARLYLLDLENVTR